MMRRLEWALEPPALDPVALCDSCSVVICDVSRQTALRVIDAAPAVTAGVRLSNRTMGGPVTFRATTPSFTAGARTLDSFSFNVPRVGNMWNFPPPRRIGAVGSIANIGKVTPVWAPTK